MQVHMHVQLSSLSFSLSLSLSRIDKPCCVLTVLAQKITWFSDQALLGRLFRALFRCTGSEKALV